MIDYITGGEYLNVTSSNGSKPYINKSSGQPMIGTVNYDPSIGMRVYDGNNWMTFGGGSATVNLTPNAISILKWAEKKMFEETEREHLAKTNPVVKNLLDQIKLKEDQLKMVETLLKSSGNEGVIQTKPLRF
jgi:hypothetical protein